MSNITLFKVILTLGYQLVYFYNNWLFSLKCESELADLAEHIQQKLSYFNELETINTVSALCFSVKLVIF